ncbi:MAG: ATP-binding protein [Rhodanobacteraceae bacterium]|nr:ATP-binding protein [Rhodanobacteraceae bacterium]
MLLIGPTGVGKSYLGCALAKAAIDAKHSVRYLRLPRLGDELSALQAQGRTSHWLKTLAASTC